MIRAAGGIVWRSHDDRDLVVVHRPAYDDWSLPKGKLTRGEHPMAAAVREVAEETAVDAVPQMELPPISYDVLSRKTATGRAAKVVRYWSMRAVSWNDRPPDDEVDEVRWVHPAEAMRLLTYEHDRAIIAEFLRRPPVTGVVALLAAGAWQEPTAPVLALLAPTRFVTARHTPCVSAVSPVAEYCGAGVEQDTRLTETTDLGMVASTVLALAQTCAASVVCPGPGLVPLVLAALSDGVCRTATPQEQRCWLLAFSCGTLVSATPLLP